MLDIKQIRENVDSFKTLGRARGIDAAIFDTLISLDEERRQLIVQSEEKKQYRNTVSQEISELKRQKENADAKIQDMKQVGEDIKEIDERLKHVEDDMEHILVRLPNMPHESVPVGESEEDNVEVRRWSEPKEFTFEPKAHWEIAEHLGILDFERGAKVSGSRFVFYKGLGARLERACYNYMLDMHVDKHGYTELITPYIVNAQSMFGTGQFPKFKEDVFQLTDERQLTLIPTAEVPLTNYYGNEIVKGEELPIYFTAFSPSFRSEAGSAGRDTRGLIRLHQFHKVEMVKFARPEQSYEELEKMVANAEDILQGLELPYRVLTLCTQDMGFSAAKTYDLEVWIPAQNMYREISSCSNCEAFQARRAKIRFRHEETGKVDYVHTLNGSGLAVGRTVAAILENYQNEDGSVTIPKALVSYMGGIEKITKD
ncbi:MULTISPECIES: serine--tRNA ligase [unclassified Granulicatella]|uniref:serine--tRNA ligase n=1 Tax=unclassified Granulicatella TaxID=2630493 RepID=UPI0010741D68|nr:MULTISPECIES: serine--tRNA ligase [unclassified Granulicatella]MBF0780951.1 serine--tRNA ligase [Granulicatella sp. 19428wC4_WM01]TFU92972.1 serine--tRNA ligase [Granulicatella sp. WM01]